MGEAPAEPLNLVFLGCGAATRMHARTITRMKAGVRLHYASRDAGKAAAFAAERGGGESYGSYAAALADRRIDVALVATPPATHLDLTLEALAAGKHVIVEKPAYPTAAAFARVRAAMQEAGRQVLVAENYGYKPLLRHLRRLLADGAIGTPLSVQVNAFKKQAATGWRRDAELAGGGALMEGGIHWVHFMAGLGLEVRRVQGHRLGKGTASDESVLVVFEYTEGAVGTLAYSWRVRAPLGGLRISKIYGDGGAITFESNGGFVFVNGARKRLTVPDPRDAAGYRRMFADFFEVLRTGRKPEVGLDEAERDVRLIAEAYASMEREGGDGEGGEGADSRLQ